MSICINKKKVPDVSEDFLGGFGLLEFRGWLIDYYGISLEDFMDIGIRYLDPVRMCRDLFVYYAVSYYGVSFRGLCRYLPFRSVGGFHKSYVRGLSLVNRV